MSILIVDDDAFLRENIAAYLRLQGHEVYEAKDGRQALEIALPISAAIRAVITDIEMPHLDGIAMWEQMKRMVASECKVLFMTGNYDRAQETGSLAGELLIKPFSLSAESETGRIPLILGAPNKDNDPSSVGETSESNNPGASIREALGVGAFALDAGAIGAIAVGAMAIGRLRILEARVEKLSIGTLTVDHLNVRSR